MELNLSRGVKKYKKAFYKYTKGRLWSVWAQYYEMGDLVTQDLETAEVMNAFLPQSFLARPPPRNH